MGNDLDSARERLRLARGRMAGAKRAAELGDLVPGNGPEAIKRRLERASSELAAAEEAWRIATSRP